MPATADSTISEIPRLKAPDSTAQLLRNVYRFIGDHCRRLGTDAFRTRVAGVPVVCTTGEDAAKLFYGRGVLTRKRGIPRPTLTLLQDFGSVQGLDGEAHRHRKRMFMDVLTPEGVARLAELAEREWRAAADRWDGRDVVVETEAAEILCRAVCAWTGVPLPEADAGRRAAELRAMFDGAGSVGPRQVRGQLARRRGEAWLRQVVDDVRAGRATVPDATPLAAVAAHRGLDGQLLTTEVAAVELLNLLRPTVAICRFATFAVLALHQQPASRRTLEAGDDGDVHRFVQEVRRTAPFFPLITARAKEPFEWQGHRFAAGQWMMLDLYGTNHDPRLWDPPEKFDPERFRDWSGSRWALIPQGDGDVMDDHRCAGEEATIALLEVAVRFLVREVAYEVPDQDLTVRSARIPNLPQSGMVIRPAGRA